MSLFKYFHPDRIDVLSNLSIRFSSPLVLNDPFELKPHLKSLASPDFMNSEIDRLFPSIMQKELDKLPPSLRSLLPAEVLQSLVADNFPEVRQIIHAQTKAALPKFQDAMAHKFEEMIGILCLSESNDSLLMWAHYADSHRGFVVEFDECSPFFDRRNSNDDEFRHLRKVTYSYERPSLTLVDIEDFTPFMTKGLDWQYENEWRMLVMLDSASKILGEGPMAIHLFDFPAEAIKSVILGSRMSDEKKVEVRSILSGASSFSHVRCIEAKIDSERYSIRISYD